ncbi:MAG: hypothetical protein JNK01_12960 [Devosia sp.]|nr:hypothetical protein [Devosia sp.]
MAKVAHLSQVTALFTDALPDEQWRKRLVESGAAIRLVAGGEAPLKLGSAEAD